jgi:hypothetical protein
MKTLLIILCSIMLLFGGGCAIVLGGVGGGFREMGPLILIPIAVAVLNGLVLVALFGMSEPWRPAFYVLMVADIFIAASTLFSTFAFSAGDTSIIPWALAMAGGFGLKGFLTWRYLVEAKAG